MKRTTIFVFACLLSLASFSSYAQDKFKVGLKAGVDLSQVTGDGSGSTTNFWDSNASRTIGFTGGAFMRIGDKFYLQPEFVFSQKGGQVETSAGTVLNFKQTYIDLPVLVGLKLFDVLRVNAGPIATFVLSEDKNFLESLGVNSGGFRNAIFGYQAGIGFDIKKINLDLRYEGNVNDVFDNVNFNNGQTATQFQGKGNAIQFTVGYAF